LGWALKDFSTMIATKLPKNAWLTNHEKFKQLLHEVYQHNWGEIWLYNHDLAVFKDNNWFKQLYVDLINNNKRISNNITAIKILLNTEDFRTFKLCKNKEILENLRRLNKNIYTKIHIGELKSVLAKIPSKFSTGKIKKEKTNIWIFYTTHGELSSESGIVILRHNSPPFSENHRKAKPQNDDNIKRVAICWRLGDQEKLRERITEGHYAECFKEVKNFIHIKRVYRKKEKIKWGKYESKQSEILRKLHLHQTDRKSKSVSEVADKVDIIVLSALQEEIAEFATKNFEEKCKIDGMSGVYFGVVIDQAGFKKNIIYTHIGRMGNTHAAVRTFQLLSAFNPDCLFLIGVAGGIYDKKEKMRLGDIVVAKDVIAYEYEKVIKTFKDLNMARRNAFKTKSSDKRPESHSCSNDLIRYANELRKIYEKKADDFVKGIHKNAENYRMKSRKHPRVFSDIIASGNKVIADENSLKSIQDLHSKIRAVEMEGEGVLVAARDHPSKLDVLVVKAISDYANRKKSDDYKQTASKNAAQFTYELIKQGL
jgi:nucleoside phosphorylase